MQTAALAAECVARWLVLARELEVAPAWLAAAGPDLAALGAAPGVEAWARVDLVHARVGLAVPWPRDDAGRDALLARLGDRAGRAEELAALGARSLVVELDSATGLVLRGDGIIALPAAVERVASWRDLDAGATARLGELAALLAPPARGAVCDAVLDAPDDARLCVRLDNDRERQPRTLASVLTVAGALSVTPAQRLLVERMHPLLARGRPCVVTLAAAPLALSIAYADLPWDTAVRVAQGVLGGERVGPRLGALAGATGGKSARALEITLSGAEPPGLSVMASFDEKILANPQVE